MSDVFTLVAKIQAKAGKEAELKQALIDLIEPTKAEDGCINYDLHVGAEDPRVFVFYENWQTKTHWEAHNASEHLKRFMDLAETLVEASELTQLHPHGQIAVLN